MTLLETLGASILALSIAAPAIAKTVTVDLWSRAYRSGPLRAGNVVDVADHLNRIFESAGSDIACPHWVVRVY